MTWRVRVRQNQLVPNWRRPQAKTRKEVSADEKVNESQTRAGEIKMIVLKTEMCLRTYF